MRVAKFEPGQAVRYIPNHANGDVHHPDCEDGVVTRITPAYVMVRYKGVQPEATDAADLVLMRDIACKK